jgi:uncharacterized membrane protein YfcA
MDPMILWYLLFGTAVGIFSGVMGLGGGALMIPVMVMAFGMSQHAAHGTSLAVMIPPVTLPAVIQYAKSGDVNWKMAMLMWGGVLIGSLLGGMIVTKIPKDELKLVFGFVLMYVAAYTVFSYLGKEHLTRSVILALVVSVFTLAVFIACRWTDGKARQAAAPMKIL